MGQTGNGLLTRIPAAGGWPSSPAAGSPEKKRGADAGNLTGVERSSEAGEHLVTPPWLEGGEGGGPGIGWGWKWERGAWGEPRGRKGAAFSHDHELALYRMPGVLQDAHRPQSPTGSPPGARGRLPALSRGRDRRYAPAHAARNAPGGRAEPPGRRGPAAERIIVTCPSCGLSLREGSCPGCGATYDNGRWIWSARRKTPMPAGPPPKVNKADYVWCEACQGYVLKKLIRTVDEFFDGEKTVCPADHPVILEAPTADG